MTFLIYLGILGLVFIGAIVGVVYALNSRKEDNTFNNDTYKAKENNFDFESEDKENKNDLSEDKNIKQVITKNKTNKDKNLEQHKNKNQAEDKENTL